MLLNFLTKSRSRRAPSDRAGAAFEDLDMFLDAGLAWVEPSLMRAPAPRKAIRMFFMGAVDALSERYRLGDAGINALMDKALRRVGLNEEQVQAAQDTDASNFGQTYQEGRDTMESWLDGDADAPLRLAQLVREWKSRP